MDASKDTKLIAIWTGLDPICSCTRRIEHGIFAAVSCLVAVQLSGFQLDRSTEASTAPVMLVAGTDRISILTLQRNEAMCPH